MNLGFTVAVPLRRRAMLAVLFPLLLLTPGFAAQSPAAPPRVEVAFPASLHAGPLNGRLYLLVSTNPDHEPRFQINDSADTQQIFGLNVEDWRPGQPQTFTASALGYPLDSLRDLKPGSYTVQALLNVYTTFHLADGRVLQLPKDEGEGQQWNLKPGNLYSAPLEVSIAPGGVIHIELSRVIPTLPQPKDTPWIKYVRLESRLLTHFWGQPVSLGAIVLLPPGFRQHPRAHYPLIVYQGHFQSHFGVPVGFRDHPPDPGATGRALLYQQYSYRFYRQWSEGKLPHVLLMVIQHANPYYDDSYAVNSANIGPYGDAITRELIPYVEKKFRGIGQPWARALYGGSTGGWETLAMQIFYPTFFNGAWGTCPDPVDFHAYQIVNLYKDKNAYWLEGPFSKVPRPSVRTPNGTVVTTMARENRRELVLGDKGRSTRQFNVWQAVFSPAGPDGYPARIWNPRTGVINRQVARYWEQHYDLRAWLARHWATLGPQLRGKLHLSVGDMDTYYLNNAVQLLQKFMDATKDPHITASFEYGPGQPHCYWGGPAGTTSFMSGLTAPERIIPALVKHMKASAPAGADLSSWNY